MSVIWYLVGYYKSITIDLDLMKDLKQSHINTFYRVLHNKIWILDDSHGSPCVSHLEKITGKTEQLLKDLHCHINEMILMLLTPSQMKFIELCKENS